MPALPSSILEPLWPVAALLLPVMSIIRSAATGPGSPTGSCSTSSSRSWCSAVATAGSLITPARPRPCAAAGMSGSPWVAEQLRLLVLGAYDQLFGLELEQLAVDSCMTKAPCGGQVAGPSPVDRRKQGLKRSVAVEAGGIPWPPCRPRPTSATMGCWPRPWTPSAWSGRSPPGPWSTWTPATTTSRAGRCWPLGPGGPDRHPRAASTNPGGSPWVIERTHAWGNQYGKLRWCTERRRPSSSSGWPWRMPPSSVAGSSAAPGPTTAGTAAHAAAHDRLLAQPLSEAGSHDPERFEEFGRRYGEELKDA